MFCAVCGKKIADGALMCSYCGTSVNMKTREEVAKQEQAMLEVSHAQNPPAPQESRTAPAAQPVRSQAVPVGKPEKKRRYGWVIPLVICVAFVAIPACTLLYQMVYRYVQSSMTDFSDTMDAIYWEDYDDDWDSYDSLDEYDDGDSSWEDGYERPKEDIYAEDGYGIGYVGDCMHTYWFDFTVNNVLFCDSFQGFTAEEGYQLIVMDLTLENTFGDEVPMFDTDFWVEWDNEEGYAFPVMPQAAEGFLPEQYRLPVEGETEGLLMYEVPEEYNDFLLLFEEEFESDTWEGAWFGVYLSADTVSGRNSL